MEQSSRAGSLADPMLLETIDKLFELNIGNYIDLPQLIVVGDQSSGKSSVLEGLTGFAFPRNSGLCTRFCTQIIFRRSPVNQISVSIIAHEDAAKDCKDKMSAWSHNNLPEMTTVRFAEILQEVHTLMDLGNGTEPGKQTFSNDVLKIEICGPVQEHLSVIDIPGIFKKTTKGLTTKSDMDMVRAMVIKHMNNQRSVILAVVPANVDIATQEILDMAELCDPKGQRTLGVITKPDLVDKGAEQTTLDIIQGKSHKLSLGWNIVKNPGQQQLNDAPTDRHNAEKAFFQSCRPWTQLDGDTVGIKALEIRLREVLAEVVRREFPSVKTELSKRLDVCRDQLVRLGPPRANREHQHAYLLRIATEFQEITSCALKAHYGEYDIFDGDPDTKLATSVISRNAMFSSDVASRGHTFKFDNAWKKNSQETGKGPDPDSDSESKPVSKSETAMLKLPAWKATGDSGSDRYIPIIDDLEHLFPLPIKVRNPQQNNILSWLKDLYTGSRGFEMGSFDPSLLTTIWRKQSAKWDNLAFGYICDMVTLVHKFMKQLLVHCCRDERVCGGLESLLSEHLLERYKKAIDHVKFVLEVERGGTPMTTNHYFADNLEKCRQKRFKSNLAQSKSVHLSKDFAKEFQWIKIDDLVMHQSNATNLDFVIQDLHDTLYAYYKLARKRFVDVVCMQAADFYLIAGKDTPLKVFTPAFVSSLSKEQLESIAGEDLSTRRKRKELRNEITNLEKGRKVLI